MVAKRKVKKVTGIGTSGLGDELTPNAAERPAPLSEQRNFSRLVYCKERGLQGLRLRPESVLP